MFPLQLLIWNAKNGFTFFSRSMGMDFLCGPESGMGTWLEQFLSFSLIEENETSAQLYPQGLKGSNEVPLKR